MRIWFSICALIFCTAAEPKGVAGPGPVQSRHVVVVVWDGMRPDFVSAELTPTLWKLAQEGVTFRNHHAVYLSSTNVNGTTLATGVYPSRSGIIANHEFRPQIDNRKPVDVENKAVVDKGDALSHGKYIAAPTIAELLQRSGQRTMIAASKTVGLLHDRHLDLHIGKGSVTLSAGLTWPRDALNAITSMLGPFPKAHAEQDIWTTRALVNVLWSKGIPVFSLLWLGEPDLTEHETAPGAEPALRAIKASDDNLGLVLSVLERQHVRETTDIFVVSDHGFSTIERKVDLPKILADAGFQVVTEFKNEPRAGDIMMVGGGGSVLFYVTQRDASVMHRLVDFLQQSNFAGVIFTREAMDGTFALNKANIDSPDAPDVIMSFRWSDAKNQFGIPGMIDGDWQRAAGKGTHATLSRFDMHNTLIAAGPDFRHGVQDDLPTGNVDVAPTILHILGGAESVDMDGRVLSEAIVNSNSNAAGTKAESKTIEAERTMTGGTWRQSLRISRIGKTSYCDDGNGTFIPANR